MPGQIQISVYIRLPAHGASAAAHGASAAACMGQTRCMLAWMYCACCSVCAHADHGLVLLQEALRGPGSTALTLCEVRSMLKASVLTSARSAHAVGQQDTLMHMHMVSWDHPSTAQWLHSTCVDALSLTSLFTVVQPLMTSTKGVCALQRSAVLLSRRIVDLSS
jgi:hypothetical protein